VSQEHPLHSVDPAFPVAVRKKYGDLAPQYDRRWARYIRRSVDETVQRVRLLVGENLLDVGCGTGALLATLLERGVSAADLVGFDLVPAMLKQAPAKLPPRVRLVAGDVGRLPFPAHTFDVVVSTSSFHYWPDPAGALREIARVLAPGGRVIITDWCDDFLACRLCDLALRLVNPAHQRSYSRAECAAMLAEAGYEVQAIDRYKIDWMWGLMTASAKRGRRFVHEP
jgi:ubiquinone/menaquinone biosynthesis C-methylase UbiE